jgi:restriction system protein
MARTPRTTVPRVVDLFVPTIRALQALGGSASIEEIDEKVADILGLPEEIRSLLHNDGPRTKLQYRCAWARSWLKQAGFITNSERGVWALTQSGDSLKESDFRELPRIVRQAGYAARKNREAQDQPEEELESEATALADWREQLLDSIVSISPDAFERLSQRILRESGFTRVLVTGRAHDGGIDGTGVLRVNLLSFYVLFQCKRWKGSVGPSVVRDFRGAMMGRADKGLIITTGTFSADARKEATRDGAPAIDLIDGDALCTLLKNLNLGVAVKHVEEVMIDPAFFTKI